MENGHIRLMSPSDLKLVLSWRNHPNVRRYAFDSREISWPEHVAWYEKVSSERDKSLLIFELEGVPSGFIRFNCKLSFPIAEWSFHAAPERPTGIGKMLCRAGLQYGYLELGLIKVYGRVLDSNERSIRLHLRLGFKQEGLLRSHYFDGKQYHSVYCFGLLKNEWLDSVAEG